MKNWLLLVSIVIALVAVQCAKEEDTLTEPGTPQSSAIENRTPPQFVTLCHVLPSGGTQLLQVHPNAVDVHLGHGDYLPDADGDGYSAIGACTGSGNDCDDNNPAIYPGAVETCNGLDDDCDGATDAPEDDNTVGSQWYFEDADNDGHGSLSVGNKFCEQPEGWVSNISDCDDEDPNVYPGSPEIPNDGIDQDCSGSDSTSVTYGPCECFTMEELQALYNDQPWPFGWFSDVPGSCKAAPYDQLMELWLTNIGQPAQNYNFSAQAGTINGLPFASQAKFNHLTGQFETLCGGYTDEENAGNCAQILHDFIAQMRSTHPTWDYCIRFP